MSAERLAEALIQALTEAEIPARLDGPVNNGVGYRVKLQHGLGLVVYDGKGGPKFQHNLKSEQADLLARIEAVWAGVVSGAAPPAPLAKAVPVAPSAPARAAAGIELWVDGSYVEEGSRTAVGWGLIVVSAGGILYEASGADVPVEYHGQRNVAGEITAVLKALAWCQAREVEAVTVCYDYEGLEKWVTGAWRANHALTAGYARAAKASGLTLQWRKIGAHTGERYNEMVDKLARNAARSALASGNGVRPVDKGVAQYAQHLAAMADRWVQYADLPSLCWGGLQGRLTELAQHFGMPVPPPASGPLPWRELAERIADETGRPC